MLPVILVAVGAYLIGDSVLSDKKYAKGGELDAESAKKRLEELRKELRAERISYSELAELESLKKYIDDDDVELRQAAGIPEFEDEDDDEDEDEDDDKYAKGGEIEVGDKVKAKYAKYHATVTEIVDDVEVPYAKITYSDGRVKKADLQNLQKVTLGVAAEYVNPNYMAKGGATKKLSNNSSLVRFAQTDEQLQVLQDIIPIFDEKGIELSFGTAVGKSPQAIIFDKDFQDGILYIGRDGWDGECTYDGEYFGNESKLEYIIENPEDYMAKGGKTNGDMTDADKAMKEGYVQQVVEIATKANENGIKASDLTYEEFSDKVFEATSTSYGKDYLRGAYEIMTKKGYAEGGMMDEVNTEVIAVKGNIMGTTTLDLKIKGMRKPQDFIVYPISTEEAGKPITIQSDTRFGYLDLSSGRGLMSQSHANGAYSYHFAADKKVPFKISETDVKKIKEHLASKASSKAGNSVIFSDNSGADKMAKGGETDKKYYNLSKEKMPLKLKRGIVLYDKKRKEELQVTAVLRSKNIIQFVVIDKDGNDKEIDNGKLSYIEERMSKGELLVENPFYKGK
jgi:hypothetical protein